MSEVLNYKPQERGLTGKVLGFFVANPDEELASVDIAEKWDVRPSSSVFGALDRVVRMGLLAREKVGKYAVFRAGVNLARWAAVRALEPENQALARQIDAVQARAPVPIGAIDIRVTLRVHGAGTPFQRVEIAGVEP